MIYLPLFGNTAFCPYLCSMKQTTMILGIIALCGNAIHAQHIDPFFNTIGVITESRQSIKLEAEPIPSILDAVSHDEESDKNAQTIERIADMLHLRERKIEKREGSGDGVVLSLYEGARRELNIDNLLGVLDELGISNKLFVLAQAVLETGHFGSRVCLDYNNLFGLFDSRSHDYYRFEGWEDSVVGYKRFIQDKYQGGNYLEFLEDLGYAEDPDYTHKVADVALQLYKEIYGKL